MADVVKPGFINTDGDAADWTPRQALLHVITQLDELRAQHIVIAVAGLDKDDGVTTTAFSAGSYNHHGVQGLLLAACNRLNEE